ncbi:MAG: CHAP domain-containing protein [Gammaproteobacteria bacterium]
MVLFISMPVLAESSAESEVDIPKQCATHCKTTYGSVLGESPAGVPAYSNCNSDCVIFEPNHLQDVYTGIKWQCVEYARRWLLREKGVVYGDVDIAADIWNLQKVIQPLHDQAYEFHSIVNGAVELPQRGDLLIYGKEYLGTGHVAVVVGVDEKKHSIQLAEQNYANTTWQQHYAREIPYIKDNEQVWLLDSYLIGWKRVILTKH